MDHGEPPSKKKRYSQMTLSFEKTKKCCENNCDSLVEFSGSLCTDRCMKHRKYTKAVLIKTAQKHRRTLCAERVGEFFKIKLPESGVDVLVSRLNDGSVCAMGTVSGDGEIIDVVADQELLIECKWLGITKFKTLSDI